MSPTPTAESADVLGLRPTQDVLNVSGLPSTDRMELDYRTAPYRPQQQRRIALYRFVSIGFLLVICIPLLRLINGYLLHGIFLALLTGIGFVTAYSSYRSRRPLAECLLLLFAWPAVWFLFHLTSPGRPFALYTLVFLIPVTLSLIFANAVVRHYAAWMHANPRLDRSVRSWWRGMWLPSGWAEVFPPIPRTQHAPVSQERPSGVTAEQHARELRELDRYRLSIPAVAAAYIAGFIALCLCNIPVFAGMLAFFTYLAVLVGFGIWNLSDYGRGLFTPARTIVLDALTSWLTYNSHRTIAPGVFKSPFGHWLNRSRLTATVLIVTTVAVLPTVAYFPLGMLASGPGPWIAAYRAPWMPAWLNLEPTNGQHRNAPAPSGADNTVFTDLQAFRWHLNAQPERWFSIAFRGTLAGQPLFIWTLLISLILCVAAAPLMLFVTCFAIGGRVLLHHYIHLEATGAPYQHRLSTWEAHVRRLQTSAHALGTLQERGHLWLGTVPRYDYPVLLDLDVLREHAHILGDSGSGKTALGLAPLVAQLIRRGDCSVVILDLKGDPPLFQSTLIEAANARGPDGSPLPCKWFTNEAHQATYLFNPLTQSHTQGLTPHQRAEVLLQSLGLDHGEGYGASYFSRVNRDILSQTFTQFPEIRTFTQIHDYLPQLHLSKKQQEDGGELLAVINSLAAFDALNVTPDDGLPPAVLEHALDLPDVFERPQVLSFYLPATLEQASVREIGKLALYTLLTAAVVRRRKGGRPVQTFVFIDEFQRIVSSNLEIVLEQARSMGIGVILSNQTISDLKNVSTDLIPKVQANTRFKQYFSASDLQQQDMLMKASGDPLFHRDSWIYEAKAAEEELLADEADPHAFVELENPHGPRLSRNRVVAASDHPQQSIVHITRSRGYTQFSGLPFVMLSEFHIPRSEYERRGALPWPATADYPGTIVTPLPPKTKPRKPEKPPAGPPKPPPPSKPVIKRGNYVE
jgi:hypothetical protein